MAQEEQTTPADHQLDDALATFPSPYERPDSLKRDGALPTKVDWVDRLDHLCAARKAELTKLLAATSDETLGLRCNGKLRFVEL